MKDGLILCVQREILWNFGALTDIIRLELTHVDPLDDLCFAPLDVIRKEGM